MCKNSSGDEIANVNFACRGQRLCPLNDFVISTKHLTYLPTQRYCLCTYPSNLIKASYNVEWTRPSNLLRSKADAPINYGRPM